MRLTNLASPSGTKDVRPRLSGPDAAAHPANGDRMQRRAFQPSRLIAPDTSATRARRCARKSASPPTAVHGLRCRQQGQTFLSLPIPALLILRAVALRADIR